MQPRPMRPWLVSNRREGGMPLGHAPLWFAPGSELQIALFSTISSIFVTSYFPALPLHTNV
jgi:hypothetical protein